MTSKKIYNALRILLGVLAFGLFVLTLVFHEGPLAFHARMTAASLDGPAVTSYAPDDRFYLLVNLSEEQAGHVLEAKWYLISADGYEPGELKTDSIKLENSNLYYFENFHTDGYWPVGEYKAEVYYDGALVETLNFSVSGENPQDKKPLEIQAHMVSDIDGPTVTSYAPEDHFYLVVDLSKAQAGHDLEVKWHVVSADGYEPGELYNASVTLGNFKTESFEAFDTTGFWSVGEYKAEVYFDGVLMETVNFSVSGENPQDKQPLEIHAHMSSEIDGPTVTSYAPEDHFYLVADLSKVQAGHVLEVKWHLVSADGYETGELSGSSITLENFKTQSFETFNTAGFWVIGEYKAEVYFDGVLVETVNFSVK